VLKSPLDHIEPDVTEAPGPCKARAPGLVCKF